MYKSLLGLTNNMKNLGALKILEFLEKTNGEVIGRQISDAKNRIYKANYHWEKIDSRMLCVNKVGSGEKTRVPATIDLDESLIAFFGLYSGDGAKGSEDSSNPGTLRTSISFSQREPNLVKFAVKQFKKIFPSSRFTFSLGEDSAYFMAEDGLEQLKKYYGNKLPPTKKLLEVRPNINEADKLYLSEKRHTQANVEEDLAFFYQHKKAMEEILTLQKLNDIKQAGIELNKLDRVTASLRRPFKKGARLPGGSSRSDETHVGNVSGMGELFLKMMHELEETIFENIKVSPQGLVAWSNTPNKIGENIDIKSFFETNPYGCISNKRPKSLISVSSSALEGTWQGSKTIKISKNLLLSPLWCYTSGLYLAEGSSPKHMMFDMYKRSVSGFALGFTSSENTSLELVIRSLKLLFPKDDCVATWKVKVGSQYFPELVVVGLKNAVPMLRGGNSGDGKMRTMEISLAIKNWALEVITCMKEYEDKYSHVEPTGAGVPRIDFSASSSLCKWYFPLIMYTVFSKIIKNPETEFVYNYE